MNFTPLNEEEIQVASLLPEGLYNYLVIKSEDKVSKAGNEYIGLTIKVWDNIGKEHQIFTNLALIKLLKHFCDANGMQEEYNSGNVPAEKCFNKSGGHVIIGIEGEKPNPNGGMYRAKNIVKDYVISSDDDSIKKPLFSDKNFISDDIPF